MTKEQKAELAAANKRIKNINKYLMNSENLSFQMGQLGDEMLCDEEPVKPIIMEGVYVN